MVISLKKLNYLVTVAEAGNFSRAAELLRLSQPALSKSISEIEEAYGVRLFDRSRSGVQVTLAGAAIIGDAKGLLRNARSFDQNFRMLAGGERGNISFGIGPSIASLILSRLAVSVFDQRSNITLCSVIRPVEDLISKLTDETIELFVAAVGRAEIPPEIETQEVGVFEGGFFVRKGHPLTLGKKLKLQDIIQYPIACPQEATWFRNKFSGSNIFLCDNYRIMYEFVLRSDGICHCPHQFATYKVGANRLAMLQLDDWESGRIPIVAARLRGRALSPLASQLIDYCKSFLADKAPMLATSDL